MSQLMLLKSSSSADDSFRYIRTNWCFSFHLVVCHIRSDQVKSFKQSNVSKKTYVINVPLCFVADIF